MTAIFIESAIKVVWFYFRCCCLVRTTLFNLLFALQNTYGRLLGSLFRSFFSLLWICLLSIYDILCPTIYLQLQNPHSLVHTVVCILHKGNAHQRVHSMRNLSLLWLVDVCALLVCGYSYSTLHLHLRLATTLRVKIGIYRYRKLIHVWSGDFPLLSNALFSSNGMSLDNILIIVVVFVYCDWILDHKMIILNQGLLWSMLVRMQQCI